MTAALSQLTPEAKRKLCAEALGWTRVDTRPEFICGRSFFSSPRDSGGTPPNSKPADDGEPEYDRLPDFTDPTAAILLIDHLAGFGWRCNLANGLDKTWECEFTRAPTVETDDDDIGSRQGERLEIQYAAADTLAEAIVDAFLLCLP